MGRRGKSSAIAPRETAIQAAIVEHWELLGEPNTLVACIPNQHAHGQPGLTRGLPDLLVMGPRVPGVVAFIELKRDDRAPLSDAQKSFRDKCDRLGIVWRCARGRDEPIAILELWGVVKPSNRHVERQGPALPPRGEAGATEELERDV